MAVAALDAADRDQLSFVWLEVTGKCQLNCVHCYASSGPRGTHGSMSPADWVRVIDEAADLGVSKVQFIGGEPTLHPDMPALVGHALGRHLQVEIYTNLVRVTPELWEAFDKPGVHLATSYYSPDAGDHDAITGRRSHDRTLANIREAVRRNIPVRVGVVGVESGQDVDRAVAEMRALGILDVGADRLRQVGRGVRQLGPNADQLCGACTAGRLAVMPSGHVYPCVFARWLPVGNVHDQSLAQINTSAHTAAVRAAIGDAMGKGWADPKGSPQQPTPPPCSPNTNPCAPAVQCGPAADRDGQNPRK